MILLVEDNLSIIKGLLYSFKMQNLKLEAKTSIREAQEFIENNQNIDLIILDITLPDGDGFKLYEDIIKERNIPVIFLTAKDDEETIVKALENGAEDYVTKPFSTKELLARVNKVYFRRKKQSIIKVKDITFDF